MAEKNMSKKAAKDRGRGLSYMAVTIERIWGGRCGIPEPTCPTCHAWQVFDYLVALTDSSFLEDEQEKQE